MNTAMMANTSMPYRPEPTPPNTTSPICIRAIGTMPPNAVNESCIAFTAPQDAAVVTAANKAEALMPKRLSLPSILPPDCSRLCVWSIPKALRPGCDCCSAYITTAVMITKMMVIAASTAHPWRISPTMKPKVKHSAAGIRKMASICMKFDSGVGFSYG